eukprot:m.208119 g.208119  ORF g.208119 m.208119 type:complete len:84 (+) comp13762_c0_seq110:1-252(+)
MQQQTMEREDDMFSTTATTGLKAMYERVTGGKRRQNAAANGTSNHINNKVPLLGGGKISICQEIGRGNSAVTIKAQVKQKKRI